MILTKLDQHVNEMMTTAGKKFHNCLWSRFLIIVQNVNMVTNGKRNNRLNPIVATEVRAPGPQRTRISTQVQKKYNENSSEIVKKI